MEIGEIMNRKEIYKQISDKTSAAETLLREAQKLADESGISFTWDFERDMSGTYSPKLSKELREQIKGKTWEEIRAMGLDDLNLEYCGQSDEEYENSYTRGYDKKWGWLASARSC